MNRKQELEQIVAAARRELNKIETAERDAKNKALVGKCFKYRNSCGVSGKGDWWLYQRVIATKGGLLEIFAFQVDCYGVFEVETKHHMSVNGDMMPLRSFQVAWAKAMKRLDKLAASHVE